MAEKELACAVIHQALRDLEKPILPFQSWRWEKDVKTYYWEYPSGCENYEETKRFLTRTTGEWERSLMLWAEIADLDADDIRKRAQAILDSRGESYA